MEEVEQGLRELQEERSNLSSLLVHPGFKWLLDFCKQQQTNRQERLYQPLAKMDSVLEQEFLKGEIVGYSTMEGIVQVQVDLLSEQIEDILKESQHDDQQTDDAE